MVDRQHKGNKVKTVCITGITGFIGQHLAAHLQSLGYRVIGTSRSIKGKGIYTVNLFNKNDITSFIEEKKVDACFHLAAEATVELGQENPHHSFAANINSALNILEACRKMNVKKIIIASSVHVYGKNRLPYYEGYTPRPSRPYETSKACVDLIAQSYAKTYQLPVFISRFVNIYGPGDLHKERLIPKIFREILQDNRISIWGGEVIRDYLYINDAVEAYAALLLYEQQSYHKNNIFNFGSGNAISVNNLVQKILALSSQEIVVKKIPSKRSDEIVAQYASFAKAKKVLGWIPKTSLDIGLQKTLSWYKTFYTSTGK